MKTTSRAQPKGTTPGDSPKEQHKGIAHGNIFKGTTQGNNPREQHQGTAQGNNTSEQHEGTTQGNIPKEQHRGTSQRNNTREFHLVFYGMGVHKGISSFFLRVPEGSRQPIFAFASASLFDPRRMW
jgi:hypothetical protein